MTPDKAHVRCSLVEDDRVLRIHIDHGKGNVLTGAVMDAISAGLAEYADRPALKLVLLTAQGRNFSFGASVEEHRREEAPAMLATFNTLVRAIARNPVPVAMVVQGRCLGGAFELALACHVTFATPSAVFAVPEVRLGVFPPAFATLGPLRLGGALADRMMLTGGELDAEAAQMCGFTVPIGESESIEAVLGWYRKTLAPLSAWTLRQATAAIRSGSGVLEAVAEPLDEAEARYLEHVVPSHDGNEGIEAFISRRPPVWADR